MVLFYFGFLRKVQKCCFGEKRATRGSARSKAIGKRAFHRQVDLDTKGAYDWATEVMAAASQSPDAREGVQAFLEKRRPEWNEG